MQTYYLHLGKGCSTQDFSWMTMPNADLSHVRRGQVTPAVDVHHSSLLEFIGLSDLITWHVFLYLFSLCFMSRGPEQIATHHTLMFL